MLLFFVVIAVLKEFGVRNETVCVFQNVLDNYRLSKT